MAVVKMHSHLIVVNDLAIQLLLAAIVWQLLHHLIGFRPGPRHPLRRSRGRSEASRPRGEDLSMRCSLQRTSRHESGRSLRLCDRWTFGILGRKRNRGVSITVGTWKNEERDLEISSESPPTKNRVIHGQARFGLELLRIHELLA